MSRRTTATHWRTIADRERRRSLTGSPVPATCSPPSLALYACVTRRLRSSMSSPASGLIGDGRGCWNANYYSGHHYNTTIQQGTCRRPVPAPIAGRVLEYAQRNMSGYSQVNVLGDNAAAASNGERRRVLGSPRRNVPWCNRGRCAAGKSSEDIGRYGGCVAQLRHSRELRCRQSRSRTNELVQDVCKR